jgi:uncharacterized membrane protein
MENLLQVVVPQILQALLLLLGKYYWAFVLAVFVVGLFGLAKLVTATAELIKVWRSC